MKATVKLVFQPGEEGYSGAYQMLQDGCLDDMYAILCYSIRTNRSHCFKIQGRGAHASSPHLSRDPILAATSMIVALQQIVSPETDPLEAAITETLAAAHQCNATVSFMEDRYLPQPVMINDEALYKHGKNVGDALLGEPDVQLFPVTMGGEDFSFFSQRMPAAIFYTLFENQE